MATNSSGDGLLKIGNFVSCKTCFEDRISGEVMAYDPNTKMLVLKTPAANSERKNTHDIRIVNLNCAKEPLLERVGSEPPPRLPRLNVSRLNKRTEEAIAAKKEKNRLQHEGVSPEGHSLFVTIKKTLPCRWEDCNIIVNEDVKVVPPYGIENCQGKESALAHIRKIIEKFHKDKPSSTT